MRPPEDAAMPADSCPRCCSAYSAKYARRAMSCPGAYTPNTPHSSRGPSRGSRRSEKATEPLSERLARGAARLPQPVGQPTGMTGHQVGHSEDDLLAVHPQIQGVAADGPDHDRRVAERCQRLALAGH